MPQELTFASSKSVFDEALSVLKNLICLKIAKLDLEEKFSTNTDDIS